MGKQLFFITLVVLVAYPGLSQEGSCDYFGLSKPTTIPQDFNPRALELDGRFNFNVEIKRCDEVYFTTITGGEVIYYSQKKNGTWSKPKIASFSDPNYNDADPFLTADGSRIYFISKRPTSSNDRNLDWNIWSASRENGRWAKPQPLPTPINSEEYDEYFFSISNMGNAFFSSNRPGGKGSFDIYTTKILGDNSYGEPKNIGGPISTEQYEFDPYIAPDESYLVLSINENGNSSLHVSHKDDNGNWTSPQNLGDRINRTNQDFAPSLSEDGRYLFYSNNGKLRWVSTELLKQLK